MGWPYDFHSNWETGDATEWDQGETDTENKLDVAHYSTLAGMPLNAAPFQGAYVLRWQAGAGTKWRW